VTVGYCQYQHSSSSSSLPPVISPSSAAVGSAWLFQYRLEHSQTSVRHLLVLFSRKLVAPAVGAVPNFQISLSMKTKTKCGLGQWVLLGEFLPSVGRLSAYI
jgi:hypothetical protein